MNESTKTEPGTTPSGDWRDVIGGLSAAVVRTLEIIDEGGCPAIPAHLRDSLVAWGSRADALLDDPRMAEPYFQPVSLRKEVLVAVLREIAEGFETGDTLEGSIEFSMDFDSDPTNLHWRVQASYRIGNRDGQGGTRIIGSTPEGRNG